MRKLYIKTSIEWCIFSDIWGLLKDYGEIEDNEQYWSELTEAAISLRNKYKNSVFAKKLIIATLEELERKSCIVREAERENGETNTAFTKPNRQ